MSERSEMLEQRVRRYIPPMGSFNWSDSDYQYEDAELFYAHKNVDAVDSPALLVYDIFIPMLGIFIIFFNALVVISSGLVIRKGENFL